MSIEPIAQPLAKLESDATILPDGTTIPVDGAHRRIVDPASVKAQIANLAERFLLGAVNAVEGTRQVPLPDTSVFVPDSHSGN